MCNCGCSEMQVEKNSWYCYEKGPNKSEGLYRIYSIRSVVSVCMLSWQDQTRMDLFHSNTLGTSDTFGIWFFRGIYDGVQKSRATWATRRADGPTTPRREWARAMEIARKIGTHLEVKGRTARVTPKSVRISSINLCYRVSFSLVLLYSLLVLNTIIESRIKSSVIAYRIDPSRFSLCLFCVRWIFYLLLMSIKWLFIFWVSKYWWVFKLKMVFLIVLFTTASLY